MHFIGRIASRAVSVILVLMLIFGTTLCAKAQEPDIFGINLGSQATEQNPEINPLAAVDNIIDEAPAFNVTAESVSADSAVIKWESESTFISYTVKIFNIITRQWEDYLTTVETSVRLDGLAENSEYSFAVSSSGSSDILGVVKFSTGVKKAEISVKNRSSKQIELEINRSESVSKLFLYKSEDGKEFEMIADVTSGSYIDSDVKDATKYYYKVEYVSHRPNEKIKIGYSNVAEVTTLKSFGLPDVSGSTKTYAYYTAVTARRSPQYKLLRSEECYTDEETGIRMVDGCYCVALGSYYGTTIGTKYKITLEGGKEFDVILCDQKSDRHTDENHQYARRNKDVVEFYVERHKLPKGIRGDFGRMEKFSGDIVSIEQYVD